MRRRFSSVLFYGLLRPHALTLVQQSVYAQARGAAEEGTTTAIGRNGPMAQLFPGLEPRTEVAIL